MLRPQSAKIKPWVPPVSPLDTFSTFIPGPKHKEEVQPKKQPAAINAKRQSLTTKAVSAITRKSKHVHPEEPVNIPASPKKDCPSEINEFQINITSELTNGTTSVIKTIKDNLKVDTRINDSLKDIDNYLNKETNNIDINTFLKYSSINIKLIYGTARVARNMINKIYDNNKAINDALHINKQAILDCKAYRNEYLNNIINNIQHQKEVITTYFNEYDININDFFKENDAEWNKFIDDEESKINKSKSKNVSEAIANESKEMLEKLKLYKNTVMYELPLYNNIYVEMLNKLSSFVSSLKSPTGGKTKKIRKYKKRTRKYKNKKNKRKHTKRQIIKN
jgi:hypothetical protein